jgi:hypothetical protein
MTPGEMGRIRRMGVLAKSDLEKALFAEGLWLGMSLEEIDDCFGADTDLPGHPVFVVGDIEDNPDATSIILGSSFGSEEEARCFHKDVRKALSEFGYEVQYRPASADYYQWLVAMLNAFHMSLQQKPVKAGLKVFSPKGILDAYREGDVSHEQAIAYIHNWADHVARLREK